jgi:hypothetical protein
MHRLMEQKGLLKGALVELSYWSVIKQAMSKA